MVITKHATPPDNNVFVEHPRCARVAESAQVEAEITRRGQRVGVVVAKQATPPVEGVFVQLPCFTVASHVPQGLGEMVRRP